jgi:hypothetical protein
MMSWATVRATFSQTHLATLFRCTSEKQVELSQATGLRSVYTNNENPVAQRCAQIRSNPICVSPVARHRATQFCC